MLHIWHGKLFVALLCMFITLTYYHLQDGSASRLNSNMIMEYIHWFPHDLHYYYLFPPTNSGIFPLRFDIFGNAPLISLQASPRLVYMRVYGYRYYLQFQSGRSARIRRVPNIRSSKPS